MKIKNNKYFFPGQIPLVVVFLIVTIFFYFQKVAVLESLTDENTRRLTILDKNCSFKSRGEIVCVYQGKTYYISVSDDDCSARAINTQIDAFYIPDLDRFILKGYSNSYSRQVWLPFLLSLFFLLPHKLFEKYWA